GFVVAVYLREGRTAGRLYKLLLAGLRIFLILLTLTVLLPQVKLWFEREGWPDIAILVDDSRSMSTADHYQDAALRQIVQQLGKEGGSVSLDRLGIAQALLTQNKAEWLDRKSTRLNSSHQIISYAVF